MRVLNLRLAGMILWVGIFFFGAICDPVAARVYWRSFLPEDSLVDLTLPGAKRVEHSRFFLDGRECEMEIISLPTSSLREARTEMRRLFENRASIWRDFTGRDSAWGLAVWPDRLIKYHILTPLGPRGRLVSIVKYKLDSKRDKRFASPLDNIPLYPGATPRRRLSNKENQMDLRTFETGASRFSIQNFYARELAADDWKLVDPVLKKNNHLRIYSRQNSLCYVFVKSFAGRGKNMIILMSKMTGD